METNNSARDLRSDAGSKRPKGKQSASGLMNPLPSLLNASSMDAGNRSMVAGGRKVWSRKDANAAADEQHRLIEACYGEGREGSAKYSFAHALERAGYLTIATKDYFGELNAHWQAHIDAVNRWSFEIAAAEYQVAQ